jgi:hypothetical protein
MPLKSGKGNFGYNVKELLAAWRGRGGKWSFRGHLKKVSEKKAIQMAKAAAAGKAFGKRLK